MGNVFCLLGIVTAILLYFILLIIKSKKPFLIKLTGEIFFGIGIAFLSGAVISSNIITQPNNFLIFSLTGALTLLLGVFLKITSEILLKNQN